MSVKRSLLAGVPIVLVLGVITVFIWKPFSKRPVLADTSQTNSQGSTGGSLALTAYQLATIRTWNQLEHTHWILDGAKTAPRVIYVFTDPNCPYCNALWSEARPWVDGGKVQLRQIVVGILTPSSPGKAAALLTSPTPELTFSTYERLHVLKTAQAFANGEHHPLDDTGLSPLQDIPVTAQALLDANDKMMEQLGFEGVPVILWRDAVGNIHTHVGLPSAEEMTTIFGPR